MVKCPKCGREAGSPVKTWLLSKRVSIGLFECPGCKTRFRRQVKKGVSIKKMVEEIKEIKGELMQTLKNLREKIKTLEAERANLLLEIEKLKKMAEARVSALEDEVTMLREEVKSLRELLGCTESKRSR